MREGQRVAALARVHGRVHGVGFRAWTVEQAELLGLDGWVANRSDGTVEALVSGLPEAVDRLFDQMSHGPVAAKVERVEREIADPPSMSGFHVRR